MLFPEPKKALEILDQCEVLVVGSGPSGLSAALASKRAGVDTIICEAEGCFGGTISHAGMESLSWYRYEGCENDSQVRLEAKFVLPSKAKQMS